MRVVYDELVGQKMIDGAEFPLVLTPQMEVERSDMQRITREESLEWISTHREELRTLLLNHGALLFRGFPLKGAHDFEAALDAAEFVNMPYIGGAAPREEVTQGRILTANESPPEEPIPFHHEMAQIPNPPAYVFFYCEIAPEVGGATPIVHSHRVYQRFQEISPTFCEKVETHGVRYRRVMPAQDDITSPIGRSWRSTFQTEDHTHAEERMRDLGTTWRWLEDGSLYTETATIPAIRVDQRSQKATFFNSMVAAYLGWTDERNDPTQAVICGDGSSVDGEVLLKTAEAMREESVSFLWREGDMLWIDNQLVLHSRQPFKGARRILASIAIA